MQFIDFQAEDVDGTVRFDLEYEEDATDKIFLDGGRQEQCTSLNFYRKFHDQSREISNALNDRSEDNCRLDTRHLQPEMYWETVRDHVQFDEFEGYERATEKFKNSFCSFESSSKDSFTPQFYMV